MYTNFVIYMSLFVLIMLIIFSKTCRNIVAGAIIFALLLGAVILPLHGAMAESHPFWVEKTWNEERTVWVCGNQPQVLRFRDEDGYVWQMYNSAEIRKDFQLGQEYTLRIGNAYFWLAEDERPCPLNTGTDVLPELEFSEDNWWALP